MIARYRSGYVLVLAAVLIGLAGCQTTTTGRTTSAYVDDARIADDVKTKIVTDPMMNGGNVSITSSDGVVYLSGTVPAADRLTRATQLASEVRGVRNVVNNLVVVAAPPTMATVMVPPPGTVVVPPANVVASHPPVDVSGIVAQYDQQNRIITFQDGRAVRMTTESRVAGPVQPGAQITVLNAQPIAYQTAVSPVSRAWRIGTVSHVDAANGLIFLTDGTAVRVGPSTQLRSGAQVITLSQLQPGSQVAVSVASTPAVTVTPAPSTIYGSALPRQTVVPLETPEVRIFVVPR